MADPLSSDLLPVSTSVRSAPGFRSRFPLPSGFSGAGLSFFFACDMIQSGVLRIFRMAVRGVCSLSALPVCFVSLLVRPVLSVLSALSALSCSVLLCPLVHPPVCPFVRLFRLLSICSICSICSVRSSNRPFVRLSIRSAVPSPVHLFCLLVHPPALSLRLSAHSSPSALSALSVCPVRLSARPAPEPPNFIPPISPSALFFLCGMIFPCPISDTLLKSRRGELGISDNDSYLWMQKMSFAHKNTTGYNEKS